MINILIVDDNTYNRMILKLLLEDYEENHNVEFNIDEACDGVEAVQKSKDNNFNIIFMDIIMPNMDGIEATKIIKERNLEVMIISVSAVHDDEKLRSILSNGAEDHFYKPVNTYIFNNRMSNYIILVEARGHQKKNTNSINLFTDKIFSRHTNFIIKSEDSISEFWEFFLLNARKKNKSLNDVVRTIFSISEVQRKLSIESSIYIEESDELQFFTLTGIDKLPKNIVQIIIKKNKHDYEYKIEDSKISFKLFKIYTQDEDIEKVSVEPTIIHEVKKEDDVIASPVDFSSKELVVFDYIEHDDLFDLEEYAAKLNSLMIIVGSSEISQEEVAEICSFLEKIASILSTYSEVYIISKALSALSIDMSQYTDKFIENSADMGSMCKAFSNDMSTWIQMSFHSGAPSVDFMNDTIVVNCETISGMLKMDDNATAGDDLDDIFDF